MQLSDLAPGTVHLIGGLAGIGALAALGATGTVSGDLAANGIIGITGVLLGTSAMAVGISGGKQLPPP